MSKKTGKWGLWSLKTEGWVHDLGNPLRSSGVKTVSLIHATPIVPCEYDTKREALADLKDWCYKPYIKDYEARRLTQGD